MHHPPPPFPSNLRSPAAPKEGDEATEKREQREKLLGWRKEGGRRHLIPPPLLFPFLPHSSTTSTVRSRVWRKLQPGVTKEGGRNGCSKGKEEEGSRLLLLLLFQLAWLSEAGCGRGCGKGGEGGGRHCGGARRFPKTTTTTTSFECRFQAPFFRRHQPAAGTLKWHFPSLFPSLPHFHRQVCSIGHSGSVFS